MPRPSRIFSNDDSTDGLRRYCKYYDNEEYDSSVHLPRFAEYSGSPITINYRVFFYTGTGTVKDETSTSYGEPLSVAEFFDSEGKCTLSNLKGMTKNEIVNIFKEMMDEFTNLNLGFTFTLEKQSDDLHYWDDTVSSASNSAYHHIYIFGRQNFTGAWNSTVAPTKMKIYGALKYTASSASKFGALRHEMGHALGLGHEGDARRVLSETINGEQYNLAFGNPNMTGEYSGENRGFISTAASGKTVESYVCAYDVIYNKSGNTWIYGNITGVYPKINRIEFDRTFGEVHPDAGKNFYEYGRCRALLIDTHKKEVMYNMPIDYTGHYEFSLRILPPASVPFRVLVVSKEYHHSFINKNTNTETTDSDVVYVKDTNDKSHVFVCMKTHVSNSSKKPVFGTTGTTPGSNWYDYWDELSNTDSRRNKAKLWVSNKSYRPDSYAYRPLYGYIWYAISDKLTSLVPNDYNLVPSMSLANKRAPDISTIEKDLGINLQYYSKDSGEQTTTQAKYKALNNEPDTEWQLFCKTL